MNQVSFIRRNPLQPNEQKKNTQLFSRIELSGFHANHAYISLTIARWLVAWELFHEKVDADWVESLNPSKSLKCFN